MFVAHCQMFHLIECYTFLGTRCGSNNICINQKCIATRKYGSGFITCPRNCSARGVCNNKKRCHCHQGWAPPYCLKTGFGGSIDSGGPSPGLAKLYTKQKETKERPITVIIGWSIIITILTLFLLLTTYKLRVKYLKKKRINHEELQDLLEK